MAHATAPTMSLAFGIEIELLVSPKRVIMPRLERGGWDLGVKPRGGNSPGEMSNRALIRESLARDITNTGVICGLSTNGYTEWTVVDDRSMDEVGQYCKYLDPPACALSLPNELRLTTPI